MDYLPELIRVLSLEKQLYEELTELAKAKQQVIIDNDVDKLTGYLSDEEQLIKEIEDIERKRRQVVVKLCTKLDISDKELSFSKLREYLDEQAKTQLDEFKTSLLEVLEELLSVNETNRMLVEEAMKLNDFTLRLFTQAIKPSISTYDKSGDDTEKGRPLVDKRA